MSSESIVNNMTNSTEKLSTSQLVEKSLKKRYRAEARFKAYGMVSVSIGLIALLALFTEIISKGTPAFMQTYVQLEVNFDAEALEITDVTDDTQLRVANYSAIIRKALIQRFPDVSGRREKRSLYSLVSVGGGYQLQDLLRANPQLLGETKSIWLLADDDVDSYYKSLGGEPYLGRLTDNQVKWISHFVEDKHLKKRFNSMFFTSGDSAEPEQAGILGAFLGTLLTLVVTLVISFPIGVAAAIYLEEYAKQNRFTDFIEVNINNLAAVPSVIFGLLGLAIFLNLFGMPRSIPLVGGLVLSLMTLPTIIIASRAAIKSVPPSIRQASLGMGASKMQMILHHVLPLAMPGMLTGTIIGMAQALGETAPLLMIGMVAFIADIPSTVTDPATVLPVQIFLWADSPERAFTERTSAAIMVLLVFLISMNLAAVWLRKKLERRW